MERIARNDFGPSHEDANKWLRALMTDIKKTVYLEENYQPFAMERLQEWSKHRADIETCVNYDHIKRVNLTDYFTHEHDEAIMYFNGLIMDLKLMVLGEEFEAITEERIKDIDKHFVEIWRCRKKRTVFYR